jgi:hypothetical protein
VVRFFNSAFLASRRWRIFKHFRIVSMIFSSSVVVFVILNGSGDVADTQSIRIDGGNIKNVFTRQKLFELNTFRCLMARITSTIADNEGRMADGAVNHRSATALATCWNPHRDSFRVLRKRTEVSKAVAGWYCARK